jgi:hypothetical protein
MAPLTPCGDRPAESLCRTLHVVCGSTIRGRNTARPNCPCETAGTLPSLAVAVVKIWPTWRPRFITCADVRSCVGSGGSAKRGWWLRSIDLVEVGRRRKFPAKLTIATTSMLLNPVYDFCGHLVSEKRREPKRMHFPPVGSSEWTITVAAPQDVG